jgi:hypothetical protein
VQVPEQVVVLVVVPPPENLARVFEPSEGSVAVKETDGATTMLCDAPSQTTVEGLGEAAPERVSVCCTPPLSIEQVIGCVVIVYVAYRL